MESLRVTAKGDNRGSPGLLRTFSGLLHFHCLQRIAYANKENAAQGASEMSEMDATQPVKAPCVLEPSPKRISVHAVAPSIGHPAHLPIAPHVCCSSRACTHHLAVRDKLHPIRRCPLKERDQEDQQPVCARPRWWMARRLRRPAWITGTNDMPFLALPAVRTPGGR